MGRDPLKNVIILKGNTIKQWKGAGFNDTRWEGFKITNKFISNKYDKYWRKSNFFS